MQAQENPSSDDSSSMAMAIDDTLPPHLKKRTLDSDVPVATNSSAPSPSKIQATNTDSNCDITWSEVLQLLSPLRNFEPKFLPLQQLQLDERWIITDETLQAIGSLRERTYMPHTFARDRSDSWQARKVQDDCLSEEQLRTVLHFLDILYTECYMAIELRNLQDKTELLHHLFPASPEEANALEDALRRPFEDHTTTEIQLLQDMAMHQLRTMTRLPTQITSWAGRITEANRLFADLIFADSPITVPVVDEYIPLDPAPTVVDAGTIPGRATPSYQRQAIPTAAAILGDPTYNSVITVTQGWQDTSDHTVTLQLQSLLRERKKLAKSPSPDQEDLADLDAQIVVAQDDIAKARIKLGQRHTALVNDAQRYNVELPDLVELDFRDGPA
jgi:hypothetical protein